MGHGFRQSGWGSDLEFSIPPLFKWPVAYFGRIRRLTCLETTWLRIRGSEAAAHSFTVHASKRTSRAFSKRLLPGGALCSVVLITLSSLWTGTAFGQSQDPVPALLAQLRDHDQATKIEAIHQLVRLKESRAVEPLIDLLASDTDPEVRRSAAYALGQLKDPRAIQPLIASLKDENPDVCVNSIFAVAQVGGSEQERVNALLAALGHNDLHVCRAAAVGLVLLGDKNAVQPLITALDDSRLTVRTGAAYALGFLGDRRAVPALLRVLEDDRPIVRLAAVGALGILGGAHTVPALQRLASRDSDPRVRARAAAAVKKLTTAAGKSTR